MKKALLINAVDPSIGGILIRGDKGTGKSTAVRSLVHTLPQIKVVEACPFNCDPENLRLMCKSCQHRFEGGESLQFRFRNMEIVDMPLSATDDMVVGSIDIKAVLKDGMRALQPGILARANRNLLYIDEVNLLHDHLVNILLDSAAMGINLIEREGVSVYHPARFILVGTMNPEEGSLRPQILDRFGLCVDVSALSSTQDRLEVIRRRKSFEQDPWLFEQQFKQAQDEIKNSIVKARELFPNISPSTEILEKIISITSSLGVKTHRADIVMEKTACVIAALDSRTEVCTEDILEAARLALPHRLQQSPFEKSSSIERESLENILNRVGSEQIDPLVRKEDLKKKFINIPDASFLPGNDGRKEGTRNGPYIRASSNRSPSSIAIDATLRRCAVETQALKIMPEHLMEKIRLQNTEALYIILLDSSSSMRMNKKIELAKTLSWNILKNTYEKKNRVALISFRQSEPCVTVAPTKNYQMIDERLENMPSGGKTPLTGAVLEAFRLVSSEKTQASCIIVISDGRGNIFLNENFQSDMAYLKNLKNPSTKIFINTETPNRSIGVLEQMASEMNGTHVYLEDLM